MNMEAYPINASSREHNSTYEIAQSITVEKGSGWKAIRLPEVERLKGKCIMGLYVMRQSDGAKKKTNKEGTPLLATDAAVNTYLTLKKNGYPVLEESPLEPFLHDYSMGPGKYKQIILPEGVDMKESNIEIDSSCLEEDTEVLVIHYVYIDDKDCKHIKPC